MKLIAFTGHKGSGKTTAAKSLTHMQSLLSFGAPIKRMLEAINVPREALHGTAEQKEAEIEWLGVSGRRMMQTLGTEWGRALNPNIWVDVVRYEIRKAEQHGASIVVIDDVRFPNEAALVHELGGILIRVTRSGCHGDGHASETEIDDLDVHTTVVNDRSAEWLVHQVERAVRSVEGAKRRRS